jgi:hypothetical protein
VPTCGDGRQRYPGPVFDMTGRVDEDIKAASLTQKVWIVRYRKPALLQGVCQRARRPDGHNLFTLNASRQISVLRR